ncbi:MAG: amidase [Candidatus Binatota bacterium]|nr:amidase [Candidatus Binatota bacterium]
MSEDLAGVDATAQADLVRRRQISPRELVDAAIAGIERVNPKINAVILPLFERARAEAGSALPDGPFRGVPFLLKDLDGTLEGAPLHCGMKFLQRRKWVENHDSYLVRKFREAGFVIVGKTNTPELGLTVTTEPEAYGPSRNPWNPERSTGGSSGGSSAAVAAGLVPAAHASDGGGSIRIPASECGLVGLKPSRGRVSLGPDFGEQWHGLVISHAVTRSLRDTAAILDAVSGPMPGDPYAAPTPSRPFLQEVGADPGRLRVGLLTTLEGRVVHPDCVAAVRETGRVLESLGHHVEESQPDAFAAPEFIQKFMVVVTAWTALGLDEWGRRAGQAIGASDVEPATWALAEIGRGHGAREYLGAVEWLQSWTRRMAAWWAGGFDLLVTPTIGEPPPRIGELVPTAGDPLGKMDRLLGLVPFTPPFNATGQPAMSLPLHWNGEGLPIGVQFVGAYGREDLLLRIGAQLEQAMPWKDRRPPIFV